MSLLLKAFDKKVLEAEKPLYTLDETGLAEVSNTVPEVVNSTDSPNYLSFDGLGLDLLDEDKKFYEEGDYVGLIGEGALGFTIVKPNEPFSGELVVEFYDNSCESFELYISDPVTTKVLLFDEIHAKNGIARIDLSGLGTHTIYFEHFVARHPNQRVKITSVSFGGIAYFSKLNNVSLLEEINILSDDLPINSFSANIITDNFNFGYGSEVCIFNRTKKYGEFHITDYEKIGQNIYRITAENSIKLLEEAEYEDWGGLSSLEGFIDTLTNLTGAKIVGPNDLEKYSLFGHMPIKTARYALCGAAFVSGLMIDASRSSEIVLRPIPTTISSYIDAKRIIGNATFKKEKNVTSATYEYTQRDFSYVEKYLEPKNKAGVRLKYIYDNPCIYYEDNLESDVEITVYGQSYNYLDFVSPTADVKIPVLEIAYPKASMSIINPLASSAKTNTKSFNSFGLVGIKDSVTIEKANDILKFIQSEGKITAKIIVENERVGDLIQIETAFDGVKTGIITSMALSFGYKTVADIEVTEWSI